MKKIYLLISLLLISCTSQPPFSLVNEWDTEQILETPESVIYDKANNLLYASNINGEALKKDGNGFISKITLTGEIVKLKWVTGMNAPKGLGIYKGRLYATDIDALIEIDISSAKILKRYPVSDAVFLNDIAVDEAGNVYISDSSNENSAIYRLHNNKVAIWLKSDKIKRPNGLLIENGSLIFGNSGFGNLMSAGLNDQKLAVLAKTGTAIDGLRSFNNGSYLFSDWHGKTYLLDDKGKKSVLLDTTEVRINSADIEFVESDNLLIIPTFYDNRLMAYKLQSNKPQ